VGLRHPLPVLAEAQPLPEPERKDKLPQMEQLPQPALNEAVDVVVLAADAVVSLQPPPDRFRAFPMANPI